MYRFISKILHSELKTFIIFTPNRKTQIIHNIFAHAKCKVQSANDKYSHRNYTKNILLISFLCSDIQVSPTGGGGLGRNKRTANPEYWQVRFKH